MRILADENFPALSVQELASLAGISHDIKEDMRKYTDKEIVGMARMEKYFYIPSS